MTILRTVGDYSIRIEKVDRCPHNRVLTTVTIWFILGFIVVLCGFIHALFNNPSNSSIYIPAGLIIVSTSFIPFLIFPTKCGVHIYLYDTINKYSVDGDYYQLSDNSEIDAKNINNHVEKLVMLANNYMEYRNKEKSQNESCCTKYRSLLDTLKKE